MFDESLIVEVPAIIKARHQQDGKRIVEVEASSESLDSEGDVILQSALLDSAKSFIKSGHLDIDHLSEIGDRLGIARPSDYIVGNPIEVKDLGGGRTSVVGELQKGRPKADELWDSITADPPVRWRASIYGFPITDMVIDCRVAPAEKCMGAKRFLVKGLDWRSLAFTRNPVNDSLTGSAHVVTAKAFVAIMKSRISKQILDMPTDFGPNAGTLPPVSEMMLSPRNMAELAGHYHHHLKVGKCMAAGDAGNSVWGFRQHLEKCCGDAPHEAEIKAHALMHYLKRQR